MSWVSSWWKAIARPKKLMVDWCQTFLGKCVVAGTPRITLFESRTSFKHLSSVLYVGTTYYPSWFKELQYLESDADSTQRMSSCLDLFTGLFAEREPLCFWGVRGSPPWWRSHTCLYLCPCSSVCACLWECAHILPILFLFRLHFQQSPLLLLDKPKSSTCWRATSSLMVLPSSQG